MEKCNKCTNYISRKFFNTVITYCEKCQYIKCTNKDYMNLIESYYLCNKRLLNISNETNRTIIDIKRNIFFQFCSLNKKILKINNNINFYEFELNNMKIYFSIEEDFLYFNLNDFKDMLQRMILKTKESYFKIYFTYLKSLFRRKNVKKQII